jgi:methyl-accepting chemotaxis protein
MLKKWKLTKKWSLTRKAVTVTVITLIVINFIAGLLISTLSGNLTERETDKQIINSLNAISTHFDGDKLEELINSGNTNDTYYDELHNYLSKVKGNCSFKYLYTVGQFQDGKFYYLVDSLTKEDEGFSAYGNPVEISSSDETEYETQQKALETGSASRGVQYFEGWGWLETSYVTIYNSSNEPVALLGADFDADFLATGLSLDLNRISNVIWYILAISIIITAVVLMIYLKKILKPINYIEEAALRIADGNLDVNLNIKTEDEIGKISRAFMVMTDNLNKIMTNINAASEQVAAGAGQVSDSSTSLSQGATEQASSIEQLTASIEEISSQTKQNAQNSNEAKNIAETAKESASQGNKQMQGMLTAMSAINDSSNNISKIIKVIDEIAFQTNILALNAAVEAARAGQHGKGFAVVAEEVRNLAARSANAAKETTTMIEDSIKNVESGTKIANTTAESLKEIVDGISKVTTLVGDIAVASNEQSIGVAQVSEGLTQIATVVQTTSATSEETAAASEELSSQAEMLKSQVKTFKLKNSSQAALNEEAISYKGIEDLKPEVLKMIENMKEKANTNSSPKITLGDKEFGKY